MDLNFVEKEAIHIKISLCLTETFKGGYLQTFVTFDAIFGKILVENIKSVIFKCQMGVSKNNGTPKSSILIGFSIINHPFWGTPIFGNTQIFIASLNRLMDRVFGMFFELHRFGAARLIAYLQAYTCA